MSALHVAHAANAGWFATTLSATATWFVMMALMMAPVAWPWAVAFSRFDARAPRSVRVTLTSIFVAGYAAAWLLYSLMAALMQTWIGHTLPASAVAAVLIGAGLVQFSALKRACLTHCRSPISFLLARWRNGAMPAWRIGFGHGIYCVGCCWAVMATMMAAGMGNVWWMAAVVAATVAEQSSRHGGAVRIAVGVTLVIAGAVEIL